MYSIKFFSNQIIKIKKKFYNQVSVSNEKILNQYKEQGLNKKMIYLQINQLQIFYILN